MLDYNSSKYYMKVENMKRYIMLVGLEESESTTIREIMDVPMITHLIIPKIRVTDGELWAETGRGSQMVAISALLYHGIYENDLDFITGLAFWGGHCLPNPIGMMDLRLKLPGLVRALKHTRFGMARGFASANTRIPAEGLERVAKWGNWHCGENKERFSESWQGDSTSVIEAFLNGQAVRVVIIGDHHWQIKLEGDDWLKSIHHDSADFIDVDTELLADTKAIQSAFGLEIIANDYMVMPDGSKYLLEVNHIPNVTRFPELREAYINYAVVWLMSKTEGIN